MGLKTIASASMAALLLSEASAAILPRNDYPGQPPCSYPFTPFDYVGCYVDPQYPKRALDWSPEGLSQNMTVELCVAYCKSNDFRYAGLERVISLLRLYPFLTLLDRYYGQCYCGDSVNGPAADQSECTYACTGDKTEVCGGNLRLSIYQDPTFAPVDTTTISDYMPLGCWTDELSLGRAVYFQQDLDGSTLTTELCLGTCKDQGYPFAATEYSSECYCGVVLGNGTSQVDDSFCQMPCNGNSNEKCGGAQHLNLYVAEDLKEEQPCAPTVQPPPSTTMTSSAYQTTTSSYVSTTSVYDTTTTTTSPTDTPTYTTSSPTDTPTSATSSSTDTPTSITTSPMDTPTSTTSSPTDTPTSSPSTSTSVYTPSSSSTSTYVETSTSASTSTYVETSTPYTTSTSAETPTSTTTSTSSSSIPTTSSTSSSSSSYTYPTTTSTSSSSVYSTTSTTSSPTTTSTSTSSVPTTSSTTKSSSSYTYPTTTSTSSSSVYSTTSTTSSTTTSSPTPKTSSTTTSSTSTTSPTPKTTSTPTSTIPSTLKTSTTTKTTSYCTAPTPTPTCEYSCGTWCSKPLPPFTDKPSCLQASAMCFLQTLDCYLTAGYPSNQKCADFMSWCEDVGSYCTSKCPYGNCNKSDCTKTYPASNTPTPPPSTCTPPPVTTTKITTSTKAATTTTSVCPPAASNICVLPSGSPGSGYSGGKCVGNIQPPYLTCNDLAADWKQNPFKLYTSKDSSACPSYPRSSVPKACQDACNAQYTACVNTYAASCKAGGQADSYQGALTKCANQKQDCLKANQNTSGGNRCSSYGSGWS